VVQAAAVTNNLQFESAYNENKTEEFWKSSETIHQGKKQDPIFVSDKFFNSTKTFCFEFYELNLGIFILYL
jgi:hypothetical protein